MRTVRSIFGFLKSRTVIVLLLVFPTLTAPALAQTRTFQIPAGDATLTLQAFAGQSREEVIYLVDRVRGITTAPVSGRMPARRALERMLGGTPLTYQEDRHTGALFIALRPSGEPARDILADAAGRPLVKLHPFEVSSRTYRGYLASRTFSGGKSAMNLSDVPQSLQVVTRDLIDDTGAIDPNDAMNKIVPGVSSFSGPGGVNATIRGFRAQNWSVDGATTRYLGMITNFNYEAFEVIKGPASVTFGPFAAYGGYINMIPKNARRNHLNKLDVSLGTDDFYSGMIDVGSGFGRGGDYQYRLVAGFLDTSRPGFPWDFNRVQLVAPSFAHDFSPDTRITVRAEFSHTDQKLSPTALDAEGHVVENFSSNGPAQPGMNRYNSDDNQLLQAVFTSQLNDEWSVRLNLMGTLGRKHFNYLHLTGTAAESSYLLYPFQADYNWRTLFADLATSWKIEDVGGSGISNHLVGSLSIDHWDIDYKIFDGYLIAPVNTWRLSPTAPDWNSILYHFDYPTRYIRYNREWLGGAVLEDRVGFLKDTLQLSLAARFNHDARSSHTVWRTPQTQAPGGIYAGTPTGTLVNEKITYRYGAVYKPVDWLAFYTGYTEAYLGVGAIYRVDGGRLKPESGANREIGAKVDLFQAFGGTFSASFALFEIRVENKWRNDPDNAGYFIQDGVQNNRGAEGQLTFASDKISGLIGFYKADGPTEQGTGLRAVLSPDETFNVWLKYNLTSRLSLGGGYRYVGDTVSNNRLFKTEPFFNIDLFGSYTLPFAHGDLTFRLGVSNLTDELAVYRIDSAAVVHREDARRVKLTTSYTW